tara:strand:+ start:667 stop:3231 length:2565 start_codon:yes stop_codon:yes gene_type:complete
MGCKTGLSNGGCIGGFGSGTLSEESCNKYDPQTGGVTFTYTEYPQSPIRSGNYNVPTRESDFVMYQGITSTSTVVSGNCGKVQLDNPCSNEANSKITFDYYPSQLSFDFAYSDRFFAYLYDTSNKGGVVGTPCYHIEDGVGTTSGGSNDGNVATSSNCYPCAGFTCTASTTTLSYTCETDYTGDPDCPHPSLFGFGTTSNKIAFSYDALSSQQPDGVTDFSLSYDGTTYVDAWNQTTQDGIPYTSTQNPWQSGDESLDDFTIYEINGSGATTGLRLKVRIRPIVDESGSTVAFTGTEWEVTEILAAGTSYSVNDVFSLSYTHTHPDTTTSTLTVNLKITAVGPVDQTSSVSGFDVLRTGDTVNGHTLTRVFHMDEGNFPYHVAYLDGNGSNFTKDTQYTSNRAHQITTVAGKGIVDRAILVGKYEFSDKSMQFITADVDLSAPDIYNTIKQPDVDLTITNGRVTGATINNGGTGWNQLKEPPDIIVTPPLIESGTNAEVEATFSAGVLTALDIKRGGSGYDENNPPKVWIRNNYKKKVETFTNDGFDPTFDQRNQEIMTSFPKPGLNSVDLSFMRALDPVTYDRIIELGITKETMDQIITENESLRQTITDPNAPVMTQEQIQALSDAYNQMTKTSTTETREPTVEIKLDNDRRRTNILPQRKYSKGVTDELREIVSPKYDLAFLEDNDQLDNQTKEVLIEELDRTTKERSQSIDDITQASVPEISNHKESFVETVQGSFTELPAASTGTKYFMTQYRADPTKETNISVTLSMNPVNTGCAHFSCSAPSGTSSSSGSDGQGGTVTTNYTMSGLLGPGCKAWSANGTIRMFHDLSSAALQAANAGDAYGNPYGVT